MNIFILSENPQEAATMMLNKHVVKMPTESMQMLSTISNHVGLDSPYKPVMLNHPCTMWARLSKDNFQWLIDHCNALCNEYNLRYNKVHKVQTTMEEYHDTFMEVKTYLPNLGLTPFAIAIAPNMECRKHPNFDNLSTVNKYRLYYLEDKWYIGQWTFGSPEWWPNDHIIKKQKDREHKLYLQNEKLKQIQKERLR